MKKGFTLIETIAVLLLVAILALSMLISLLPMTQALAQIRANSGAARKARLAMARISREFTTITNVVSGGSGSSMTYDYLIGHSNWYAARRHTVSLSGDQLMLQGVPLADKVASFNLNYTPGPPPVIDVVLTMSGDVGGDSFSSSLAPRNMSTGP